MKLIAILALVFCLSSVVICNQNEEDFDDLEDEDDGSEDTTLNDQNEFGNGDSDLDGDNSDEKDGKSKPNGPPSDDQIKAQALNHVNLAQRKLNDGREYFEVKEFNDIGKKLNEASEVIRELESKDKDEEMDQFLRSRPDRNQHSPGDEKQGVAPNVGEAEGEKNGENGVDEQNKERGSVGRRRRSTRRRRRR